MKLHGQEFTNSDTCKGVVFAPEAAPLDFAEITITGRYPEQGWAVNHTVHEMVRIHKGIGVLVLKDVREIDLREGDVVHVPPETLFAWRGDMTLHMSCSPQFDPAQYEIIEENDKNMTERGE